MNVYPLISGSVHACMLSHFSCVQLCATLWTVAQQAPLSIGFSRQEYWSGLPFPSLEDIPDPEMELMSLVSPVLQADSLHVEPLAKLHKSTTQYFPIETFASS